MTEKRALIPNSFTMTNMVLGFIAIIIASEDYPVFAGMSNPALAGIMIFVASFFDFLDGSVARALKVENPIGAELDSLADAISYGIAPGFIAYKAFLSQIPQFGLLISVIFPICAVYRLARFNIGSEENGFSGLPSPAAGITVSIAASLSTVEFPFFGVVQFDFPLIAYVPLFILSALLMVSKVDYKKLFSEILKQGKAASIITVIILLLLLFCFRQWAIFGFTVVYVAFGLILYMGKLFRKMGSA